jgi:hypothetical protein
MISALPKLKQALNKRADLAETSKQPVSGSVKSRSSKVKKTDRSEMEKLAEESGVDIKFEGNPEDQIIVFDLDETLIAGDKHPIDKKREKEINEMGDRHVETVPKDHPLNERGQEIKYVLRPGAKELLEYLHTRGYKMIACTRNYADRGDAICDHDPILSKYISGCLGRKDLQSDLNKDFKKYPHHPDKLGLTKKVKGWFHNAFIVFPKFMWLKTKSIFNGKNIRWTSEVGSMGKYPPNMLELLAAKGNTKLQGLKAPRFLVDNSDVRELRDSKQSGDWAYINSNTDKNGDKKETPFFATDKVPMVSLIDSDGKEIEGYQWVKKVIDGVERGWKEQYKETTGKEPILK